MRLLFIDNWFDNAFIQALGWTLFHSLWQGFLLVVLVSLTILLTRRSTATIRYGIFSSLFFLFLGSTVFTFIIEYSSLRSIPTPILLTGNELGDSLTLSSNPHTAAVDLKVPLSGRLAFYFNAYGPWLMLLWFIVFLLKSIRLGINYAQVQRIRKENSYFLPAIEKRVNELAKLLRIRRTVKLRETTSIAVPVTMGFLKPLILIPCGLINNLPADQVEAILLHELAHIRRMDYLVNLLQCLAETIFFFNPAVLWLSSLMREERENCCDDMAITVTQNKSVFIHALVAFQEYHAGHPMAPGLTGTKYLLLKRIQRIVYNTNKKLNHMEKIFLALGLVVTGIVALAFNTPKTHKEKAAQTKISQPSYPGRIFKDSIPNKNERLSQKRAEESLLLDKIVEDKNKLDKINQEQRNLFADKLKDANGKDANLMELFNEKLHRGLQDKFIKDLKDNQELQKLLNDKVTTNNEEKLFKKLTQKAEADKLFKDTDEEIFRKNLLMDDKDNQWLLKDKIAFQKDFNEMLGKIDDTTKPRKSIKPKNPDAKGDDYESRQEYIREKKREMENELKEKQKEDQEGYKERMKEMAAYRAMLQKELRETERRIAREKQEVVKDRNEQREERENRDRRDREADKRDREEESRMEEREKREEKDREEREERKEKKEEMERREEKEDRDKQDDNASVGKQNSNTANLRNAEKRTELEARIKESADRRQDMIRELKEDDIIPDDAKNVNIHIDDDKMIVNGVQQPENIHKKYLGKFSKDTKKVATPVKPGPANKPV